LLRSKLACVLALSLSLSAVACMDEPGAVEPPADGSPLAHGGDFVAIPRIVDAQTLALRRQTLIARGAPATTLPPQPGPANENFYLAIKRNALGERYFLSAFMQQYFPGGASNAAYSLGTRVVSFKIQNDQLFVFDVDDRVHSSDTFDPQRLVEAYPIVHDPRVIGMSGSEQYVIFDPSAGLNRFNWVSDSVSYSTPAVKFEIELTFNQRYKPLTDGFTYEQVFTGYADRQITDGSIDWNRLQGSGTLAISLRRYREGSHYVKLPAPAQPYYFLGYPALVPNAGQTVNVAAHWDIYPGMRPIEWVISRELAALDDTPGYADVDVVGAVKAGIEGWNQVFGFPVFTARVARADEPFGRDDLNYVIFDEDPTLGYAFANWRTNPNTGETLGASVYINTQFFDRTGITDDLTAMSRPPAARPAAPAPRPFSTLRWGNASLEPLCFLTAADARRMAGAGTGGNFTAAEKFERYIRNVIAHEIGHDLGLRHNFKGSLLPPTSSVMEYSIFNDAVAQAGVPGSYDVAAIRYLYGMTTDVPAVPFCTDENADAPDADPDCRRFDFGADPLTGQWKRNYDIVRDWYTIYGTTDPYWLDYWTKPILDYANKGSDAQRALALQTIFASVAAPLDPASAADPIHAAGADIVMRWALPKLAPPAASPEAALVDDQVDRIVRNEDGVRSYPSRRALVDLLKAKQTLAAYRTLLAVHDQLAAAIAGGTLGADDQLLSRDLLARIEAAISPYFE